MNTFLMLLLACCLTAQNATPTRLFAVGMYPVESTGKLRVSIKKMVGLRMSLRVLTARKETLYETTIGRRVERHNFQLNLDELPVGTYYIQVSGGTCTLSRKFSVDPPYPAPVQSTRILSLTED